MKVRYAIDDFQFENGSRKILVSKSKGLFDLPKPREPFKTTYSSRSGEEIYFNPSGTMCFEPKNIELDCFMVAASVEALMTDLSALTQLFKRANPKSLNRLYIHIDDKYPLVYDVYLSSEVVLDKKFSDGMMVGKFTLKFTEPSPIKSIYHLTWCDFVATSLQAPNLVDNSSLLSTISNYSADHLQRSITVTSGATYTLSVKAKINGAKSATVTIRNSGSTFSRTLTFTDKNYVTKQVTFTAAASELLTIESYCIPASGTTEWATIDWYLLQKGTQPPPIGWRPTATEKIKFIITLRNLTPQNRTYIARVDGLGADSLKKATATMNGGYATFNFEVDMRALYSTIKCPVVVIDDPVHELHANATKIYSI